MPHYLSPVGNTVMVGNQTHLKLIFTALEQLKQFLGVSYHLITTKQHWAH